MTARMTLPRKAMDQTPTQEPQTPRKPKNEWMSKNVKQIILNTELFQQLQKATFKNLVEVHRKLINPDDKEKLAEYDLNCEMHRENMDIKHAEIRRHNTVDPNPRHIMTYDEVLTENNYYVCKNSDCDICRFAFAKYK